MAWEEDCGLPDWNLEDEKEAREQQWRDGYHTTREGDEIRLKRMTLAHLRNTINYFDGFDTRPLTRELKRRGHKV